MELWERSMRYNEARHLVWPGDLLVWEDVDVRWIVDYHVLRAVWQLISGGGRRRARGAGTVEDRREDG
jgi:hypothetical protein